MKGKRWECKCEEDISILVGFCSERVCEVESVWGGSYVAESSEWAWHEMGTVWNGKGLRIEDWEVLDNQKLTAKPFYLPI